MTKKPRAWGLGRVVLVGLVVVGLAAAGWFGWRWLDALRVTHIEVQGAQHAEEAALLELARVDTGLAMLAVDPLLVADRVRRHPWVAQARATRLPTGTLAIDVTERQPVALVLDRQGRPAHFLDAHGFSMPAAPGAAYDVPILRGLGAKLHPVEPVQEPAVCALLRALAHAAPAIDALIAEVEVKRGEIWLTTTPAGARAPVSVRLGRDDFDRKLERLRAFWEQAVLSQPGTSFDWIDLRFAQQIVTHERGEAP